MVTSLSDKEALLKLDVMTPDNSDEEGQSSNDEVSDEDEESDKDQQITPPTKAKRGRPRKNVLKEAAKRMKKF
ncbi:hypothetical protein PtA15_15A164 [Puccinia triticina]|uniref:Uncharacterized protein n=1 Tax=Puccinia triticina TaxID=208348 RepID=A0ABY7D671_9BASI|nr:uncharacterized protein PtA15_15A164 [Puccinia triticina]WAQ91772.1 hypothetical protein PtA15_15A164 [Puccinia triticina]